MVTRFFNEARATSVIKHPGIVEIYDCDVVDEQAYIVMEYLEGESLAATLRRTGALASEPIAIAAVVGQIASALAAAHRKEIIHRDLKPENIFLSVEESARAPFVVKILDFGIAKLTAPGGGGSNTRTGGLLGTPVYMSPEQCRGLSTIDRRADIYALGCVMFELATGRHVFVKDASGDLLVAHIIETPPRVSALPTGDPGLDGRSGRQDARQGARRSPVLHGRDRLGDGGVPAGRAPRSSATRIPATERARPHPDAAQATRAAPVAVPADRHAARRSAAPPPPLRRPSARISGRSPRRCAPRPQDRRNPDSSRGASPRGKPTNESTFRRSASELIARPDRRTIRRRSGHGDRACCAVAVGGLVIAGVAAVFLTQNKPASPPTGGRRSSPSRPPLPRRRGARAAPAAPAPNEELPAAPPPRSTIRIVSRPAGAELWLGDESAPRGETPLDLVLRRDATEVRGVLKARRLRRRQRVDRSRSHRPACRSSSRRSRRRTHHHASSHHASHDEARSGDHAGGDAEEASRGVLRRRRLSRAALARSPGTGYRAARRETRRSSPLPLRLRRPRRERRARRSEPRRPGALQPGREALQPGPLPGGDPGVREGLRLRSRSPSCCSTSRNRTARTGTRSGRCSSIAATWSKSRTPPSAPTSSSA